MFLVPLLWLIYTLLTKKRIEQAIFSKEILEKLTKSSGGISLKTRTFLTLVSLFFMIIALSRPVLKNGEVEVESKSVDLVFAIDISKSMLAKDRFPNRLEFAKKKIVDIIANLKGNRVGVIAFANSGYTLSPLTFDRESVIYLVKNIDTEHISEQGTNIENMLQSANMFLRESKDKILIVFSDGGDSENYEKEIDYAKENDFKIFVVGVGSESGSPIEDGNGRYIKDNGNIVISKFNSEIKELAFSTGGFSIMSLNSEEDVNLILNEIEKLKSDEIKRDKVEIFEELFKYPLLIATLFLIPIFYSIPNIKLRKYSNLIILIFMISLLVQPKDLNASLFDWFYLDRANENMKNSQYLEAIKNYKELEESDEVNFNIGNALYLSGDYNNSIERFKKVSGDLKQNALYNIGNAEVQLGNLEKAKRSYEKALSYGEKPNIRENLEWVKRQLEKKREEEQNRDKKSQNQNEDNQQKNGNQNSENNETDKNQKENENSEQNSSKKSSDQKDMKNSESKEDGSENRDTEKKNEDNSQKSEKSQKSEQINNSEKNSSRKDAISSVQQNEDNLTEELELNSSAFTSSEENLKELQNLEEGKILELLNRTKGGTKIYQIELPNYNNEENKNVKPW
jgi:Ca-activated chloride channel family protein